MKNVYDGTVITADGTAIVTLPDWFEALDPIIVTNLPSLAQFAQAVVPREIQNNQFTIRTDKPSVKVSWQVTGIRQDAGPMLIAFRSRRTSRKNNAVTISIRSFTARRRKNQSSTPRIQA